MDKATPRPWTVETGDEWSNVFAQSGVNVAHCGSAVFRHANGDVRITGKEAAANAALIVRAVNSFDDLLAACKAIVTAKTDSERVMALTRVHLAIAKADPESSEALKEARKRDEKGT